MIAALALWVPGLPRPQGSLKIVTSVSTGQAFAKNSPQLITYRNFIVGEYAQAWGSLPPLNRPVRLTCDFRLPRPKNHFGTGRNAGKVKDSAPRHPAGAPDLDKLARCQGDALTIARVVEDDALIVEIAARKAWADDRGPGVNVTVTPL